VGLAVWVCVLKSGVHATLAGVAVAFFIPLRAKTEGGESPLEHLEHTLHPWVAFAILPFFAFANAGISLEGLTFASLLAPVPLGIAAGLFIGKQIGVFIGFTMSLFIGTLAFDGLDHATGVRLGVLLGSLLSAVGGYLLLRFSSAPTERTSLEAELQQT
jgi:NhaA family Na+:H+ antiporter